MNAETFVQNVKLYCAQKGVAPTVACRDSGAGKSLMSQVAQGIVPSIAKVQLLAKYLGVTTSDLLGENGNVSNSDTLSTDELRHLAAYRAAPAEIRAIVDAALKPYIG